MTELEEKIGYVFSNKDLLQTALTHSSYANEHGVASYERLEFLGDAVLGFVSAEYLYNHQPEIPEGRMTRLRSEQVSSKGLSSVGRDLGLGKYMRMSRGEEKSGGRDRSSIHEDMIEAIIAAIYLDSGIAEAQKFIMNFILKDVDFNEIHVAADNKSVLQEILQQDGEADIRYEEISESGPDHDKTFVCRVIFAGAEIGRGSGKTKKEAEQNAAGRALMHFGNGEK